MKKLSTGDDREGHIDDCPVWCGEPCDCLAGKDPDAIYDRMRDAEVGV